MRMKLEQLESRDVPTAFFTVSDKLRAYNSDGQELWSVPAYETWRGEIDLASGDVNGDGVPDAIIGAGIGGGPHVRVLNGRDGAEIGSFFAYDPKFNGGVNVGYKLDYFDGGVVITGAGPGGGPHVKEFAGNDLRETRSFFAGPADYTGGVRVAGSSESNPRGIDTDRLASTDRGDGSVIRIHPSGFQSRPSAPVSVYLGFGAGATTELIPGIYRQVADAFAPFNVNITTVQPTGPANTWATVVIGGNGSRFAAGDLHDSARGVAIVNGFFQSSPFEAATAHVFADRIGWSNPVMIGRAIAHEAAHLFGADHVSDPNSIMFAGLGTGAGTFDTISSGILRLRLGTV